MVRDCFVTEKILKELNLAELKLKTTMDIEEYNACKLYFEKNALRDVLSSEFHSKSSTSESLQKQEELKKWKQKTKIVETEKMKGTPPLTVISTTGKRKELEEPTGKIGTSLSTKLSVAGHGKELEGKLKTLKLQEEKSTWPVPEFSASDPEEELANLHLKLQGMEDTSLSAKLSTVGKELEGILKTIEKKILENTMYPTIRSGLAKFDVSLPEGLQSYVSYLFNESAQLGLHKRALHSLSSVEELREAMDKYKLKTFLSIHIREGAWQVALLFMDELPSDELPGDWFDDLWYRWEEEEEEIIGSPLYSSTSGILKAWPTEYDPDLVTLCKAITDRDWKVTGLILCRSRISDEGLKNLSTALTQGELYSLALCDSDLQSRDLKHLCEALISRDCNLTSLNVSGSRLKDEGIMYLCNVLTSVNCKLTSLNVSRNGFGDEDIMHLFTVLTSSNCTLTRLNVSLNGAGDRAVKDLARALTNKNCALTSLDIRYNEIGDEGIKYLCKALTDPNCKLRSLDLRGNGKVTDVGKQCLSEAITGTDWEVRGGLTLSRSIKSEA